MSTARAAAWAPLRVRSGPSGRIGTRRRGRAEELWHELAELAARTHHPSSTRQSGLAEIILATSDGRLEEAVALEAHFGARAQDLGGPPGGASGGMHRFRPLVYLGRADEAL